MRALVLFLAVALASCCTSKPADPEEPGILDRAADLALPLAKGYVCTHEQPPVLEDSPAAVVIWAALRALACQQAPVVAGAVEVP